LGEALDRIICAGGVPALTGLLAEVLCPTGKGRATTVQLLAQRHTVLLLIALLEHRPAVRAEVAATGVLQRLSGPGMVSGCDVAASALAESALALLNSSW
jgi:hypothetical protein